MTRLQAERQTETRDQLLTRYRRQLHQIPELDFDLPKTHAFLREVLSKYSCRLTSPSPSSLCAWFDLGREDTIAFRADMDALPIEEKTGAPYQSLHPGKMHGCGHDGHMAMVLALAESIERSRASLPHNVLLIFQPAEETEGGAESIADSGILEEVNCIRVFGCHLWPDLPAGVIGSRPGPLMAKSSEVEVEITGLSSHIAKASQGRDAMAAGAQFLTQVYEMEERELPKEVFRLLKFGIFESGTACNAISARTWLKGSLRVFDLEVFDFIKGRMEAIASQIQEETGCVFQLRFSSGHLPLLNTPELFSQVTAALPGWVQLLPEPSMTSEDFSYYGTRCPIFFFFLGLGTGTPLHADTFDFDEAVLSRGLAFYEQLLTL